jgi:hypothetical protein
MDDELPYLPIPRAVLMLQIAASFLREHEPKGITFYDEADCDSLCLADDCEAAADDLMSAFRAGYT